ncbi:MAG: cytochrome c oxidase subunit II [Desulfovibrio sp.]|jgi:cytochrome c oxidase subunit 2
MNPQVVNAAEQVDQAFAVIFGISVLMLVGIVGCMLWFAWRYQRKRHPKAADIHGNTLLEILWFVLPTIIVLGMFYFGWTSYQALRSVPADAMTVQVTGRMWSWAFEYPNGRRAAELVVPVGRAVKLDMTSTDVIHSFYVPAFRIKTDTVPGMQTYAWFRPEEEGEYDILCAEYCGLKHANMLSVVRVVDHDTFEQWYRGETDMAGSHGPDPVAVLENQGCTGCHSLDGSEMVGPTLKDIWMRETAVVLPDGRTNTVNADEPYLRRAILEPRTEVVQGYDDIMPPYEGMVSDEELRVMLHWMKGAAAPAPPPGRQIAENEGCLSCHSTDGTIIAGPSFQNLAGSRILVLDNGAEKEIVADDAYLRESIVQPEVLLRKDYDPMMPAYDYLAPNDLDALVEYIRTLGEAP